MSDWTAGGDAIDVLKRLYADGTIQNLLREEQVPQTFFMHPDDYRRMQEYYGKVFPELLAEEQRSKAITPAALVALTTFAGLEWLRHRKAEVAAAEQSGDYSSLVAEFCEWLRALIRAWREAVR